MFSTALADARFVFSCYSFEATGPYCHYDYPFLGNSFVSRVDKPKNKNQKVLDRGLHLGMANQPAAAYNPGWLQKELDCSFLFAFVAQTSLFIPRNIDLQQEQRNKHATLPLNNPQMQPAWICRCSTNEPPGIYSWQFTMDTRRSRYRYRSQIPWNTHGMTCTHPV